MYFYRWGIGELQQIRLHHFNDLTASNMHISGSKLYCRFTGFPMSNASWTGCGESGGLRDQLVSKIFFFVHSMLNLSLVLLNFPLPLCNSHRFFALRTVNAHLCRSSRTSPAAPFRPHSRPRNIRSKIYILAISDLSVLFSAGNGRFSLRLFW